MNKNEIRKRINQHFALTTTTKTTTKPKQSVIARSSGSPSLLSSSTHVTGPKTTREIAREAVEEEFRDRDRKRKRAGWIRGSSGKKRGEEEEEDGDDSSSQEEETNRKSATFPIKSIHDTNHVDSDSRDRMMAVDSEKDADGEETNRMKYRDRAKERREGKNMDYVHSNQLDPYAQLGKSSSNPVTAEMSQYLGVDETHTHLVKGLDRQLADKVRREEMGEIQIAGLGTHDPFNKSNIHVQNKGRNMEHEDDLEVLWKDATVKNVVGDAWSSHTPLPSISFHNIPEQDIHTFLQNAARSSTRSDVGKTMITYLARKLQQKHPTTDRNDQASSDDNNTPYHATFQSTTYLFSLHAAIQDKNRSWELPKEKIMSKAQLESTLTTSQWKRWSTSHGVGSTPLDGKLIQKIKHVLLEYKETHASNPQGDPKQKDKRNSLQEKNEKEHNRFKSSTNGETSIVDDDDDDIFSGIGAYVPPDPATTGKLNNQNHKNSNQQNDHESHKAEPSVTLSKGHIFDFHDKNSFNTTDPSVSKEPVSSQHDDASVSPYSSSMITSRGTILNDSQPTRSSQHSIRSNTHHDIAISSYLDGYGEDIDVDFDGSLEAELVSEKKSSKGRKGSMKQGSDPSTAMLTTAVKEYGSRGSRKTKRITDDGGGFD